MNLELIKPQNLGSLLMKLSQSNFNLRSPNAYLVRSYLIATVHHLWTFTYTILILSKPKGFDGLNLMAALLLVPMLLPVFKFVLPVVLIC